MYDLPRHRLSALQLRSRAETIRYRLSALHRPQWTTSRPCQQPGLFPGGREADGGGDSAARPGAPGHLRRSAASPRTLSGGWARAMWTRRRQPRADVRTSAARAAHGHLQAHQRRSSPSYIGRAASGTARNLGEAGQDVPKAFLPIEQAADLMPENPVWLGRARGVGKITAEQCHSRIATHSARQQRHPVPIIARRSPTAATKTTTKCGRDRRRHLRTLSAPVGGDAPENLRIIDQALKNLPDGPGVDTADRKMLCRAGSSTPAWRRSSTTSS